MFIYILNIVLLTLFAVPAIGNSNNDLQLRNKDKQNKLICIYGTIAWVLISGLRGLSVGDDTSTYYSSFERTKNLSWTKVFEQIFDHLFKELEIKDPGYDLVEKVFQIFFKDYQIYLIFIAILFHILLGKWIYKYSTDPYLSFLLYSALFYSFFAITGHRQTIATAIVVFAAYELIRKRKFIPFLIAVLLMSLVHKSALAVIPFYWLSRFKNNKTTVWLWWIPIGLSFVFRYQLLEFLQSLVGYEGYGDYVDAGAPTFTLLLLALGFINTIFYENIIKDADEVVNVSINALYIACFFSSLLLINPAMMRVVQYYSIYLMIFLPASIKSFTDKTSQRIYKIICSVLLIILLFSGNPTYRFFWQS